jgi:hypothetical protein
MELTIYTPRFLGVAILEMEYQIMSFSNYGFGSIIELKQQEFYERNPVFRAIEDCKTAIDMNYLQSQVRQMAKERENKQ